MSVYYEGEWPNGVRCIECDRLFEEGDVMAQRPLGFEGDNIMLEIVCVDCDLGDG